MSSASKVGEIFTAAGTAFSKLGELTMQLHPAAEPSPSSGKWTETEIEMLRSAVKRFGEDINQVSNIIKSRTISQIKTQLKRKAFQDAGLKPPEEIPAKKVIVTSVAQTAASTSGVQKVVVTDTSPRSAAKKQKASEVTLSALNAPDADVDIEGVGDQGTAKKLEFDSDVDSSIL